MRRRPNVRCSFYEALFVKVYVIGQGQVHGEDAVREGVWRRPPSRPLVTHDGVPKAVPWAASFYPCRRCASPDTRDEYARASVIVRAEPGERGPF